MITFEIISSIEEASFNFLYEQSKLQLETYYPWSYWPNITSDQSKKAHILASYDHILNTGGTAWIIKDNDLIVAMNAGKFKDGEFIWCIGVAGDNSEGSRSWMYDSSYTSARNNLWDTLGIDGWVIEIGSESAPIRAHVLLKQATNSIGGLVDTTNETRIVITRTKE